MRKLLLCLCCTSALFAASQTNESGPAVIYLNNGNVVSGTVEPSDSKTTVTITTSRGDVLTYSTSEIRVIDWSAASPDVPSVTSNAPVEGYYTSQYAKDSGAWWAVESVTGYSIRLGDGKSNGGFEEIDVTGGYRFNEYVRIGIGLGGRYYFHCGGFRAHAHDWSLPLYFNVRGGMMARAERVCTPFYSLDIGSSIADGFMIRPTVGLKIGERRGAFVVALSYVGQNMKTYSNRVNENGRLVYDDSFVSFVALKLGYEF